MLTKLLKTLNHSRYTLTSGAYFQRALQSTYKHHEKYLELKYNASLKNKVRCQSIDALMPLSSKGLKMAYGVPKCIIKNPSNPGVQIVCYRLFFGEFKSDVEFHLYKDQLFFYNYTFTAISERKRNDVLQLISKKYLSNSHFNPEVDVITDGISVLNVASKFNLNIQYFSPLHQPILDEFSTQIRKQKKEQRRLDNGQQLVYQGL